MNWNYSEWKERQFLCALLTVHLPTTFLGEAFPLWAWPFFSRQERNIFTLRNRSLENNNLKNTLLKSFREEIHPLQVYFAWQVQSSTLLSCERRRARNSKCCYKRRWNTDFSHSRWNLRYVLGLFSYWILPQTAFLRQQQGTENSWKECALLKLVILVKFFVFPFHLKYCKIVQVTGFTLHSWRCTEVPPAYVWFNDCVGD